MEGDDGHSSFHLARTWTDLLLEPYFLYWRDCAVVERSVDARGILDSNWLDVPKMDLQNIRPLMFERGDNSTSALLVAVGTARWMLDLGQCLRIGIAVAKAQNGRVCKPDCE